MLENQPTFESEMYGFRRRRQHRAGNLRRVQRALNAMLGTNIFPDGMLNSRTRRALRRFQQLNGIFDDGRLNAETTSVLVPEVLRFEDALEAEGGTVGQTACGPYVAGEVQRSNTEAGHLPTDFFPGPSGYPLIADFAVSSADIKSSVRTDSNLKSWLHQTFLKAATDPSLRVNILGYTDCVNKENRNTKLRSERARRVFELFKSIAGPSNWTKYRGRFSHGPAPPDQYIVDNGTPVGRATNRGVSIELKQTVSFEPLPGNCKVDLIFRAKKLLRSPRTLQIMGKARLDRLAYIMNRISDKTTDDRYMMEEDVTNVGRYGIRVAKWRRVSDYLDGFCKRMDAKDTPITDDEIIHELWRLDNAFMNGICRIAELNAKPAATIQRFVKVASVRALYATIFGLMKKVTSVYFGYQNAVSECPTRSRTITIQKQKQKPEKKDPQGGTPPKPDPKNQTIPVPPGGGSNWLWDGLKGVAKMSSLFISATVMAIPRPVLEKAVYYAWLAFRIRNLTPTALIGLAGERAAEVIAEWALGKMGISADKILDVNTLIQKATGKLGNFAGFDLMTPVKPFSVKAFGIKSAKLTGKALEDQALSGYLSEFLRLCGNERRFDKYQRRVVMDLLKYKSQMANVLPNELAQILAPITDVKTAKKELLDTVVKNTIDYYRKATDFMIPDDHVMAFHQYSGNRLLQQYKHFGGLPGIPPGLTDVQVAPKISDLLRERFKPIGVTSADLRLMLELADQLPSDLRDTVLHKGKRNWPSQWGPPPTWTSTVRSGP